MELGVRFAFVLPLVQKQLIASVGESCVKALDEADDAIGSACARNSSFLRRPDL